jgi:hypothetical protein
LVRLFYLLKLLPILTKPLPTLRFVVLVPLRIVLFTLVWSFGFLLDVVFFFFVLVLLLLFLDFVFFFFGLDLLLLLLDVDLFLGFFLAFGIICCQRFLNIKLWVAYVRGQKRCYFNLSKASRRLDIS